MKKVLLLMSIILIFVSGCSKNVNINKTKILNSYETQQKAEKAWLELDKEK